MLCALPSICVVMLSGLIPGNSGHKMLSSSFGWVTAIPDIPGIFGRFFFPAKTPTFVYLEMRKRTHVKMCNQYVQLEETGLPQKIESI